MEPKHVALVLLNWIINVVVLTVSCFHFNIVLYTTGWNTSKYIYIYTHTHSRAPVSADSVYVVSVMQGLPWPEKKILKIKEISGS
jgi:hypothetical protein